MLALFKKRIFAVVVFFPLLAPMFISGCANYEAYEPRTPADMGDGPGLFTGDEGRYEWDFD